MPTNVYTKRADGEISHGGKNYAIKDGAASVPDDAVATLVESHGFTLAPETQEDADEAAKPAYLKMTRVELLVYANTELGLALKDRTSLGEAQEAVKAALDAKA